MHNNLYPAGSSVCRLPSPFSEAEVVALPEVPFSAIGQIMRGDGQILVCDGQILFSIGQIELVTALS